MNPRRLHAPVLTRLRLAHGGDEGFALPTVLGLLLVATVLLTAVTAVTMNAVGSATSSRAAVQAQSSAEAGLARARAAIATNNLRCSYPPTNAAVVNYVVQVQYGAGVTGAPNCPTPSGASGAPAAGTALIVSTGDASTKGAQGNTTGDRRRLQGVMTAASTTESTPTQTPTQTASTGFNRAVFVGSGGTKTSNAWTLNNGTADTGGLYVNGTFTCSQIAVNGPTVVWGDAAMNGGDCRFGQNVTVTQNLTACTSTTITGTLTVGGNASGGCSVTGDAYVGGDFACSSSISGMLSVQGAISGGWGCSTGKDLRAGGDFGGNSYTVKGAMVSTSGTISSSAQGSAGSVTVKTKPSGSPGGLTVGGTSCGWGNNPACTITTSNKSATPPTSPVAVPTAPETMPVVTASTFGTPSTTWASLVRSRYLAHGTTQWAETRFVSPGETCSIVAPASVQQASDSQSLNGPLDAPADVSVVDARSCGKVTLRQATIVLNGDLTLLVNSFYSTNGISVVKGSSVPSGTTPVLRIVTPMTDGTSTCAANNTDNSITFDSGGSSLGSDVSMLLYSAATISMSNSLSFYGQMYACQIPELKNSITVNYRSLAPSGSSAPATGGTSGSTSGSTPPTSTGAPRWTLTDVRDLAKA